MYGIFTYIYHEFKPNVDKYSIHVTYGHWYTGEIMQFLYMDILVGIGFVASQSQDLLDDVRAIWANPGFWTHHPTYLGRAKVKHPASPWHVFLGWKKPAHFRSLESRLQVQYHWSVPCRPCGPCRPGWRLKGCGDIRILQMMGFFCSYKFLIFWWLDGWQGCGCSDRIDFMF